MTTLQRLINRLKRRPHIWQADIDGCCCRCRNCGARSETPETDKTSCKGATS
jgi:hypothetical protein